MNGSIAHKPTQVRLVVLACSLSLVAALASSAVTPASAADDTVRAAPAERAAEPDKAFPSKIHAPGPLGGPREGLSGRLRPLQRARLASAETQPAERVTAMNAGTLSGGAVAFADFPGVALNGTQQAATVSWPIAGITDDRGTGAGWNLSLTLSQLREYSGTQYVVGGKSLASSSVRVTGGPTVSLVGQGSSADTVTPVAAGTALDTGSPVKLLSAAANGGMGTYSFGDLATTVTIPARAHAKTYKADATVSLNSGP